MVESKILNVLSILVEELPDNFKSSVEGVEMVIWTLEFSDEGTLPEFIKAGSQGFGSTPVTERERKRSKG